MLENLTGNDSELSLPLRPDPEGPTRPKREGNYVCLLLSGIEQQIIIGAPSYRLAATFIVVYVAGSWALLYIAGLAHHVCQLIAPLRPLLGSPVSAWVAVVTGTPIRGQPCCRPWS